MYLYIDKKCMFCQNLCVCVNFEDYCNIQAKSLDYQSFSLRQPSILNYYLKSIGVIKLVMLMANLNLKRVQNIADLGCAACEYNYVTYVVKSLRAFAWQVRQLSKAFLFCSRMLHYGAVRLIMSMWMPKILLVIHRCMRHCCIQMSQLPDTSFIMELIWTVQQKEEVAQGKTYSGQSIS